MTTDDAAGASSTQTSAMGTVEVKARSFRDLAAWQRSMHLARSVYVASRVWPRDEQFGLTSQVRRSAVSVPSNIAEGHGRQGSAEFARFVSIALGSINEVETQLQLAIDLEYMTLAEAGDLIGLCQECRRVTRGLLISLRRSQ